MLSRVALDVNAGVTWRYIFMLLLHWELSLRVIAYMVPQAMFIGSRCLGLRSGFLGTFSSWNLGTGVSRVFYVYVVVCVCISI